MGTKYDYKETTQKQDIRLCGKQGFCDEYKKTILIETDYNENDPDSIRDYNALKSFTKRHEILHAYFAESGMLEYSEDEKLVSWIAWQFPKLLETFKSINAI